MQRLPQHARFHRSPSDRSFHSNKVAENGFSERGEGKGEVEGTCGLYKMLLKLKRDEGHDQEIGQEIFDDMININLSPAATLFL